MNVKTAPADMAMLRNIASHENCLPLTYSLDGKPAEKREYIENRRLCDANFTDTTYIFYDSSLEFTVECREYRDYPVAEWCAYVKNTGNTDSAVISKLRLNFSLSLKNAALVHSNGDNCNDSGYSYFRDTLDTPVLMFPDDGTSCHGAAPYMRIIGEDGSGVNIAVGWSAMWEAEVSKSKDTVDFYAAQHRLNTKLHPNETIRTPRVTILAFTGGEQRAINLYRRWYLAHILPRENGSPLEPKLCLHTFGIGGHPEFTGITEQNQDNGIKTYLKRGIKPDLWWIDAGWYKCEYEWPRIGTWSEDSERLPNGLEPTGRLCDENGIGLLVWFEPERVTEGSELDTEHPDWLLYRRDENGNIIGDRLLDLGNDECRKWITDRVDSLIKKWHIRVYRQDFNFTPLPLWEQNEAPDRIGAIENAHIQGYYKYWDELLFRNPGLWIDSCASGGRRNDLETMRRAVPLHYTDVGYGNHPVKHKQHRFMFEWIPYFRAHNMSWDNDDGDYIGSTIPRSEFDYHCAMAPSLTDMLDCTESDAMFSLAEKMQPVWRKAAKIMLKGDYYPLSGGEASPTDTYAMEFYDSVSGEGFVQALNYTKGNAATFMAKLTVDDGIYAVTEAESGENCVRTARELRRGFPIYIGKRDAKLYFIAKIKATAK